MAKKVGLPRPQPRRRDASAHRALAAIATLAAVLSGATRADAARLWVAYDTRGITTTCQVNVEDFFDCVLEASNFNDIVETYPGGHALTWGDSAVLSPSCDDGTMPTQNSSASDARVLQCIVDQTRWPVQNGDVIMFYANGGGCHGRNRHGLSVNAGGTLVNVRAAFNWARGSCASATVTGEHEAFEATSHALAADCCNGQYDVRGHCCIPGGPQPAGYACGSVTPYNWAEHEWGWYQLSCGDAAHGGVTTYRGQYLPASLATAAQQYDATSCGALRIRNDDVCAWSRPARMAGICNRDGNVETCLNGRHVEDCHGTGCTATPTPHCNAAGFAARCTVEYADAMCAGATLPATVRCVNAGSVAWGADLQLGLPASTPSSPFHAASWVSTRVAAVIRAASGASFPIGRDQVGTFAFELTAPAVPSAARFDVVFALRDGTGTYEPSPPPDQLTLHVAVEPCADGGLTPPDADDGDASEDVLREFVDDIEEDDATADAPRDAPVGMDADAGRGGAPPSGCGCRAAGGTRASGVALVALALAVAIAARGRRARGRRASRGVAA